MAGQVVWVLYIQVMYYTQVYGRGYGRQVMYYTQVMSLYTSDGYYTQVHVTIQQVMLGVTQVMYYGTQLMGYTTSNVRWHKFDETMWGQVMCYTQRDVL